ncbi:MAG: prepilin-type N-terminal cleavage/methylation domain-containing protein [Armatimonadetes bacterium]|nr:prepilin-type N-terminal cleavage/methylation domain-containing protein [Armatimonadota bacterium]NIM23706.1 prepilin-type N-terminal cleavage/methylation domain-containing protein [Armatimonadota bacterium]NIM76106.1 prepilin-type N-terminal cleavage/methylation domain-containing protein [Armatimonadota bacterium]NIN05789.1 prepilin-type N-terminal cleavage/methylation domain-containing protein [Armatimonadota bacterium]NIO76596.1 prepilin-type N-terminal cleavage/methylation domain-contain
MPSRRAMRAVSDLPYAGFTAIELMIVIAIAAVVLAILFPVSRGISKSNDQSQCATNLHTLGQALLALRDEYRAFPRDYEEVAYSAAVTTAFVGIPTWDPDHWAGETGLTGLGGVWYDPSDPTPPTWPAGSPPPAYPAYYRSWLSSECINATIAVDNPDNPATPASDETTYFYFPGMVGIFSLHYLTGYVDTEARFMGAGTATFVTGSDTVTGTGTSWMSSGIIIGDSIWHNQDQVWYEIAAIQNDITIILENTYVEMGGIDSYTIRKPNALGNQAWFASGNYLRRMKDLHCPSSPAKEPQAAITAPLLPDEDDVAYNNYDLYYRRDWFHAPPYDERYYDNDPSNNPGGPSARDRRNLVESPYPPGDALITYCPYHRRSQNFNEGRAGDEDVVLFADGTVMRLPAYPYDPLDGVADPQNPAQYFSRMRAERGE